MVKKIRFYYCLIFAISAYSQNNWTLTSPGNSLQATVQFTDLNGEADYPSGQRLYYAVGIGSPDSYTEVIEPSPMGIEREDQNFVDGLTFDSVEEERQINDNYTMVAGKRVSITSTCNELVLLFSAGSGKKLDVILRAYDDGFAFRYQFPETDNKQYTVKKEVTGFRVPAGSKGCMLPHTAFEQFGPGYEGMWQNNVDVGTRAPSSVGWCFPAFFNKGDNWVLFGETDVMDSYCGATMEQNVSQRVYRLKFPPAAEGNGTGSVTPSSTLPWKTPWRFIIAGNSPAVIIESTLFHNLASPSKIDDVSWIKPGRSSWSWWSQEGEHTEYGVNTEYINLAEDMTWEYALIDHDWNGTTVQQLIDYGKQHHVGIVVWYNSGGPHNTVTHMGPRDRMDTRDARRNEMQKISQWGIKGIKVDFFHSDKQNIIQQYLGILRDAADYKLVVNFHGCTVPRGWQRTFPNLMTAEAGRGAEWYKYQADYPPGAPRRNTIMVFTRNALCSMDYTPVTFTNHANPHITTYGHELALSVVFESGLLHLADRVAGYQNLPDAPKKFLREVPTTWDDIKYIEGTPGEYVVLARRKGGDWYLGGIDGGGRSRNLSLDLSFLSSLSEDGYDMTLITDGNSNTTFNSSQDVITGNEKLDVAIRSNGGFVAKLINRKPVSVNAGAGLQRMRNHAPAALLVSVNGLCPIPAVSAGKKRLIRFYDIKGRLVKTISIDGDLPMDGKRAFNLSSGVHILRIK
ncbi:MAG: glycoside hydrolase family 97 catalytic domain-containing protein [Chitinispirillaceae bacterium]|nr:glycoside hydrolase family 97 catalytic domain-containing protein [Chitinispirillaceae bacterium]